MWRNLWLQYKFPVFPLLMQPESSHVHPVRFNSNVIILIKDFKQKHQ